MLCVLYTPSLTFSPSLQLPPAPISFFPSHHTLSCRHPTGPSGCTHSDRCAPLTVRQRPPPFFSRSAMSSTSVYAHRTKDRVVFYPHPHPAGGRCISAAVYINVPWNKHGHALTRNDATRDAWQGCFLVDGYSR
jgi:hypothetical protein